MKRQVTRVILFSEQTSFYTLSAETGYKWANHPLVVVDPTSDLHNCPTQWPKNVQISPSEWLFFGGSKLDRSGASDVVTHLDTSTHRLSKLTEMPNEGQRLAH